MWDEYYVRRAPASRPHRRLSFERRKDVADRLGGSHSAQSEAFGGSIREPDEDCQDRALRNQERWLRPVRSHGMKGGYLHKRLYYRDETVEVQGAGSGGDIGA